MRLQDKSFYRVKTFFIFLFEFSIKNPFYDVKMTMMFFLLVFVFSIVFALNIDIVILDKKVIEANRG